MTDQQRIHEWLLRVAGEIEAIKRLSISGVSQAELLEAIREQYKSIAVMKLVVTGKAYMGGYSLPKGLIDGSESIG